MNSDKDSSSFATESMKDECNADSICENTKKRSLNTDSTGNCAPELDQDKSEPDFKTAKLDCKNEYCQESSEIDDVEKSLEETLFSNNLVLENIFKFSSFEDLKSFRIVNRLWNLEATKLLRKNFTMEPIELCEALGARLFEKSSSIEEFENLTEQSLLFPCTSVTIDALVLDMKKTAYSYLTQHGSIVKCLDFKTNSMWNEFGLNFNTIVLFWFAAKYLPNLELLRCSDDSPNSAEAEDEESYPTEAEMRGIELKKLTTLKLFNKLPDPCLKNFFQMATRLQQLYWAEYDSNEKYWNGLRTFLKMNKISLLQNIFLDFDHPSIELFEEVLNHNSSIKKVNVLHYEFESLPTLNLSRISQFLTKFLDKYSQSLTCIARMEPLGHLPRLVFPTLPKLKRLSLLFVDLNLDADADSVLVPMFPRGLNLADTFPNLETFEFEFSDIEGIKDLEPFDRASTASKPLLTVKKFKLACEENFRIQEIWMKQFCELFPNITEAVFAAVFDFDGGGGFDLIWTLRLLEKLKIQVESNFETESFIWLESDLTGFSDETVQDLFERGKQDPAALNLSKDEIEALRIKSSMVDLKHLREFRIEFIPLINGELHLREADGETEIPPPQVTFDYNSEKYFLQGNGIVLLSHVARNFAFEMCPMLNSEIDIKYDKQYFSLNVHPMKE